MTDSLAAIKPGALAADTEGSRLGGLVERRPLPPLVVLADDLATARVRRSNLAFVPRDLEREAERERRPRSQAA